MYKYTYKAKEYMSWYQLKVHPDFKNVSFPVESKLTTDILNKFHISYPPLQI